MKILSVDDRAENLYMLEALLRGHGHEVDSASNGMDAMSMAGRGRYDLIVSDILMPRMDGFQLCRELKRDPRLARIPFVFYTATYTDPKDAAFALSLGADRFLIKPVEPEVFIRQILEVMDESARKGPGAAPEPPEDEAVYLKEYNARLIAKLEKKMLDLEFANRALQADLAEHERVSAENARLEAQLRQAQKMDAIGTLAGGIAHDFNNILAGIVGFADLAVQDLHDPQTARGHLSDLQKSARRARDLVRQILAFSRQQEQELTPLRLQTAIADALRMLRAITPATVEIRTEIDDAAPAVLADETGIHQALANLVTNASHAIGDKAGVVRITVRAAEFDETEARQHADLRPGRYVRLSVTDSGRGMDEAMIERAFEPFFTTKEPGRGTGLGLSVVHGIVRASGGAISIESAVDRGATVHLYFPALELEPPAAPPAAGDRGAGEGQRILFVDDEEILTRLGSCFLERLRYEVVTLNDPAEALVRFKNERFDAVITDLTMPGITGIELGRELLKIRPGIRLVLSTGYNASLDIERARSLGFCELLPKPYTLDGLRECMERVFAGKAGPGASGIQPPTPNIQ